MIPKAQNTKIQNILVNYNIPFIKGGLMDYLKRVVPKLGALLLFYLIIYVVFYATSSLFYFVFYESMVRDTVLKMGGIQ